MGCNESRPSSKDDPWDKHHQELTKYEEFTIYEYIINNDIKKLSECVDQGLDINLKLRSLANRTLLHIACEKGRTSILNLLLKKGCRINEEDDYGITPTFLAKLKGQDECLKILETIGVKNEPNNNYFDGIKSSREVSVSY